MIWSKTDAGRIEMQARALVKERAQRNLLLVIDGVKSDDMLLASLAGITQGDFDALRKLGLIELAGGARTGRPSTTRPTEAAEPNATSPLNYADFTSALTQLISKDLGLRGFGLTLALEKAKSPEELLAVAQRALAQIADRKGDAAAAAARRVLFGD